MIEYNPNINIKTATIEELKTELLILECYTELEARKLYHSIRKELESRKSVKTLTPTKQLRISDIKLPTNVFYSRPDRITRDGKRF